MQTRLTAFIVRLIPLGISVVVFAASGLAQPPGDGPKLELVPATVELPANGEVQVQLVLRNKSQKVLNSVKLTWYTATGVLISTADSLEVEQLPAQAERSWIVRLSQSPDGLVPGNTYFRTSFVSDVPQILYATLGIASRQTDEVEKVVSVVPKTSSTVLKERNPVEVFLVINNKGNQPIRIGDITTNQPGFVTCTPKWEGFQRDDKLTVQLAPRDSINVPVEIKVKDAVRPGKHLVIFNVPVTWGAKDHLQSSNIIAQQEFDVGVLGESEILTALGVPSFLLLPGFLMIVAFTLLTKLRSKQAIAGESAWKLGANPYVWVVSITLSGLLAAFYPIMSKWLMNAPRNYLDGYGLYDVVVVWISSVAIGMLAWIAFQTVLRMWSWFFIPSANDGAMGVLRKLHLQGLGTKLEQTSIAADTGFLLQRRNDRRQNIWVGPQIQIRWLKGDNKNPRLKASISGRLVETPESILQRPRLVGRWIFLQYFFRVARRQQEVTVTWKPAGALRSAQRIVMPRDPGGRLSIIIEEDAP